MGYQSTKITKYDVYLKRFKGVQNNLQKVVLEGEAISFFG